MNFRKNSVLIIGGSIALLLMIVALVLLVVKHGAYSESRQALQSARSRLDALNNRNPFPSAENYELASQNLTLLKERYEALQGRLMQEQIAPEIIEPARFAPMLEEAITRLRRKAAEARVTLPTEAGLGFKDYAAGRLPPNDPAVMERLVVQIKALEDLVGIAIDSRVSMIDTLQRDDFELRETSTPEPEPDMFRGRGRGMMMDQAAAEPASRSYVPGVPMPADNPQYRVERFVIGVTGRENAIWDLLNRLIGRPVVYTIADLSIENMRTGVGRPVDMKARLSALETAAKQAPGTRPGLASAATEIPRDERIVGGRDPVKARIVVDMFRFSNQIDGEGAQ